MPSCASVVRTARGRGCAGQGTAAPFLRETSARKARVQVRALPRTHTVAVRSGLRRDACRPQRSQSGVPSPVALGRARSQDRALTPWQVTRLQCADVFAEEGNQPISTAREDVHTQRAAVVQLCSGPRAGPRNLCF